jgi:hypothetical protein
MFLSLNEILFISVNTTILCHVYREKTLRHPLLCNGSKDKFVSTPVRENLNNGIYIFFAVRVDVL